MAQNKKNITVDSFLLNVFHPSDVQEDNNVIKQKKSKNKKYKEKEHSFSGEKTHCSEAQNERVDFVTHTEEISFEDFLKNQ
ncbi:MAG: hypothetical protein ACMUIP_07580 [bacterium]